MGFPSVSSEQQRLGHGRCRQDGAITLGLTGEPVLWRPATSAMRARSYEQRRKVTKQHSHLRLGPGCSCRRGESGCCRCSCCCRCCWRRGRERHGRWSCGGSRRPCRGPRRRRMPCSGHPPSPSAPGGSAAARSRRCPALQQCESRRDNQIGPDEASHRAAQDTAGALWCAWHLPCSFASAEARSFRISCAALITT